MTSRLSPIFTSLIGAAAAALAIGCSFPTAGQVTAITHQSQNISAIQQTMLLADSAFKFDPTLVLTGSALDNARLIYPNMIANAIECTSKPELDEATNSITIKFVDSCPLFTSGIPPHLVEKDASLITREEVIKAGITLGTLISAGTLTVTVSTTPNADAAGSNIVSVLLQMTNITTADSIIINGKVTFTTDDLEHYYAVTSQDLKAGDDAMTLDMSILAVTGDSFALSGEATTAAGEGPGIAFSDVVKQDSQCYPGAGTIVINQENSTLAIDYGVPEQKTASTGNVQAELEEIAVIAGVEAELVKAGADFTLPAYADCPRVETPPPSAPASLAVNCAAHDFCIATWGPATDKNATKQVGQCLAMSPSTFDIALDARVCLRNQKSRRI